MLRARRPDVAPEFRAPLGPAIPLLALLLCAWLMTQTKPLHLLIAGGALGAGILLHVLVRRVRDRSVTIPPDIDAP